MPALAASALAAGALALHPSRAAAHERAGPLAPGQLGQAWAEDPLALALLVWLGSLYAVGVVRLWRSAGSGRGVTRRQVACFAGGWLALALALLSPLHPLGTTLFSAHMAQHMVLMTLAAPLLVLGAPGVAALWALPRRWRRAVGAALRRDPLAGGWRVVSTPAAAWALHAAALWLWHAPLLYQRSVQSEGVHTLQHASFLLSALLFWWVALRGRGGRRAAAGVALLSVFTTGVHASLLGALLTFSNVVWYPVYGEGPALWGLTPLADQQLGGLIMWVPGGLGYLATFLWLFGRWMADAPAAAAREAAAPAAAPAGARPLPSRLRRGVLAVALGLVPLSAACKAEEEGTRAAAAPELLGDAAEGRRLIRAYGCHSCHRVPGVTGADGRVGPALGDLPGQAYLAGQLPNNTENLVRWIRSPRSVNPRTLMPELGVSEAHARDIAAYLYRRGR